MNCDEVRELLAAEALGALAQGEQAQVRAHLAECELHAEAAELRAIALALAEAAPEREPSPELWERIEAAAIGRAESPSEPPTGPSTGPPAGPSTGSTGLPFWLRYGLAAALGAIAVGLVTLVATLATSGDASGDEAGSETFVLVYRGGGAYLRAERTAGASQVVLVLAGLDRLPPEQTYQLWVIRDQRWLRLGTANVDEEGHWEGEAEFLFEDDDQIALTIEPAGGSVRPTAEAIFRTPI